MKFQFMIVLMMIVTSMLFGVTQNVSVSAVPTEMQMTNHDLGGMSAVYHVGTLQHDPVQTSAGNFTDLRIDGFASTNVLGQPQLPLLRKLVSVPVGAHVVVNVLTSEHKTFALNTIGIKNQIMPAQPSIAKNQNPNDVPFAYDANAYRQDAYTNTPLFSVTDLGYLRGTHLVAVDFVPVSYNPASKTIQVTVSADVRFDFVGGDLTATENLLAKTASPVFESICKTNIVNYDTRATLNRYPLGYIIITPQNFLDTLQPFINWKKQQGFNITIGIVGSGAGQIGTTKESIKTYLQNIWTNATTSNPAPSYVLFVGDTGQIPAWTGTTDTSHITDLNYLKLQGTDYMPEMYYGRFSATTTTDLASIIAKTLQYEQFTMPDPSYLANVTMIAGNDNTYGPTHANGQINYGTQQFFNAAHGITSNTYLHPGSQTQASAIIGTCNSGIGFINYTAHGDVDMWYSPQMTVANINSMTNANKYFVAVGNCCLTNHFDTATCFGEAFIRAANKGAVAYVGGTNSTYWNEDYWWAVGNKTVSGSGTAWVANKIGVYDAIFHEHNEVYEDWVTAMGPMVFMGNLAVVQGNSSYTNYYWEIYSIMGDPSLIPYIGLPPVNNAQAPSQILIGATQVTVAAEPYSYVAVSADNVLHGCGMVGASGSIDLTISPFEAAGNATVVISRPNRRPFIQTVSVNPNNEPYVVVSTVAISDGNNHQAEAGETFTMNVGFENLGAIGATGLSAVLTTTDPYLTVSQGTSTGFDLAGGATTTISDAFVLSVAGNTPDQHEADYTITVSDGASHTWASNRQVVLNAPDLQAGTPTITEVSGNNNSIAEPGETIQFTLPITNAGHMVSGPVTVNLHSNNPGLVLTSATLDVAAGLGVGANASLQCQIAIASTITNGSALPLGLSILSGVYHISATLTLMVGSVTEGFESGNLTSYAWQNGTPAWTVLSGTTNAHAGNYCLKSGTISDNGTTSISLPMTINTAGNITFWRKVSSEATYDKLFFYIDNVEKENWSGTVAWSQVTYPVTAGAHTFKWSYIKDYSESSGSDCAWIDDISFPPTAAANAPMFFLPVTSMDWSTIYVDSTYTRNFLIQNLGSAEMTGTVNIPEVFTVTEGGNVFRQTLNYTIPAGGYKQYTLVLTPTEAMLGTMNQVLSFTSNDPYLQAAELTMTGTVQHSTGNTGEAIPMATQLRGNFPNPFNPTTYIEFSLKNATDVKLDIYNVKGQLVTTLVNSHLNAGVHKIRWDGTDNQRAKVSSGLYFYRFQAGHVNETKKMMLLK